MLKELTAALAFAAVAAGAGQARALDIRFHPGERVYAYQLDGQRGTNSVLVQNIAVINDGAAPLALQSAALELMSGGQGDRIARARRS